MTGELAKAVCQVMSAVRYVPETGENKFHKYKYASDEDLLTVIQPAMAANGLALIPTAITRSTVEHSPDAKGKAQWRTDLTITYQLCHSSGESIPVVGAGCGIDGEDKGAYKAATGALKYALRHTFLVPTGHDAERTREQERGNESGRADEERRPREDDRAADRPKPTTSAWDPEAWEKALAASGGLTLDEVVWWAVTHSDKKLHPKDLDDDTRAKALAFFTRDQGIERVRGALGDVRSELQRVFFAKWTVEFPEPRKKDGVSDEDRARAEANSEANRKRVLHHWYGVDSIKLVPIRAALKGPRGIPWLREVSPGDFAAAIDSALDEDVNREVANNSDKGSDGLRESVAERQGY